MTLADAVLILFLVVALVGLFLIWRRNQALVEEYAPIIDIHGEVRRARDEAARMRASAKADSERLRASTKAEMDKLRNETMAQLAAQKQAKDILSNEYATARALYDRLKKELGLLEENLEDISVGLYKPHYTYEATEDYKKALDLICDQQKALVRSGGAATCGKEWEISGDKRAGQRMTKQYLKLILRAFNGECDAAIAKVSWSNILKMEERIKKTYETINELGTTMEMRIRPDYRDLRLAELRLEYEYAEKKHQEQEEQRRIREQMREEERALREAEKARREAEEEEARNQKALEKARAELAQAKGEALEQLQLRISHLDAALHKAQEQKQKANSMAQLTRSGHVYVISNIGCFGEDVFKIGMTRRLDPYDRIWELSDASVPFDFDVHAMIYCEDAPALENAFQSHFRDAAINLVNARKEFFAVTIEQIDEIAKQRGVRLELTRVAEAKEYRQTLAIRAKAHEVLAPPPPPVEELPASI